MEICKPQLHDAEAARLADLELVRRVVTPLGERATLLVVDGEPAFHVLVRSGRNDAQVHAELADGMAAWVRQVMAR